MTIKKFNMIEVTMALTVVTLGIVGVITFISTGLRSSQLALSSNYAPEVADTFISYIEVKAGNATEWTSGVISDLPTTPPSNSADPATWSAKIPNSNISPHSTVAGVYKIEQGTGTVTDFTGYVRVWKTAISTYPLTQYIGVWVEVSYPLEAPAASRTVNSYYMEIYHAR